MIVGGLALSLGAFLFGGFMALPALIVLIPKLRRLWPFALSLFLGVLGVRGLTLIGVNPVLSYARDRAVDELSAALGGEVSYDSFEGDATFGEMKFTGLHVELPEVGGELSLETVYVDAGWFLLHRPDGYVVDGEGLRLRLDASGDKLTKFLDERQAPAGETAALHIDGGTIEVYGAPTTAELSVVTLNATTGADGWKLSLQLNVARVTVIGQTHELAIYGGFALGDNGDGLWVSADLKAEDAEVGFGIVRGSITPAGGALVCTLDRLNLKPLWARYRKVDTYDGVVRGNVQVTGNLAHLAFDFNGDVADYNYYHFTAMGLNPEDAFKLPQGWIRGRVVLIDGEFIEFEDVTVEAPVATLATGSRMNASGGGTLTLNGRIPKLKGELKAVVESGEMNQEISWSPTSNRKLSDVQPNIIIVAEQFAHLELDWRVEVKSISVDCEPLKGTLSGNLHGTFVKEDGVRVGTLRAAGELAMTDGKVKCLGLDGDLSARLIFNPNAPTFHATLRGTLTGSLGDTPIDCEVTGDIKRPGFIFKGANMALEDLSKKIFRYSATELTPAEVMERREQCSRIFGPGASAAGNPFLAKDTGNVFFSVR
jgi:hypothetical protein